MMGMCLVANLILKRFLQGIIQTFTSKQKILHLSLIYVIIFILYEFIFVILLEGILSKLAMESYKNY